MTASLIAILAAPVLLIACGSSEEPLDPEVRLVEETADPLPRLERGYQPYVSRSRGLAFGRPPGWEARELDRAVELRAPDGLVVVSLSADRTSEALAANPQGFPGRVFAALEGYEGTLDPSEPRPLKHRYEAVQVTGRGVAAENGLEQALRVIVLRRKGVAVVTAVIAENAKIGAPAELRQALEMVATLRTRPPEAAAANSP